MEITSRVPCIGAYPIRNRCYKQLLRENKCSDGGIIVMIILILILNHSICLRTLISPLQPSIYQGSNACKRGARFSISPVFNALVRKMALILAWYFLVFFRRFIIRFPVIFDQGGRRFFLFLLVPCYCVVIGSVNRVIRHAKCAFLLRTSKLMPALHENLKPKLWTLYQERFKFISARTPWLSNVELHDELNAQHLFQNWLLVFRLTFN